LHNAIQAFRYLNIVAFAALGLVALRSWRRRRNNRPALWAFLAFASLGLVEVLTLIPNHPHVFVERAVGRVELALLVLFPYLLFRFTGAFKQPGRRLANGLFLLTAVLITWSFALPAVPQPNESWSITFLAYIVAFMVHWAVLSSVSAIRLWRAGATQPTVARRRMQLMASASAALVITLIVSLFTRRTNDAVALVSQILAFASVIAFLIGFVPPAVLRFWWRSGETKRMQNVVAQLLSFAESQEEVAERVLEPAAAIVGARAIAIRNAEGHVVGAWNVPGDAWSSLEPGRETPQLWPDAELVEVEVPGGSLVVWTSSYTPFFGEEELALLQTLGGLTGLALDRVRLYQVEHEARLALERANEVKANFVALAAHELRTPMTAIHGFVTTLHHLRDRLNDAQEERLRTALVDQTQRMASLIEQLLDLSKLDADAIEIAPEPLHVRTQVEQIVAAAAREPGSVEIDVAADAVAVVDRNALERIVTNLVTNAFRYGSTPVIVRAAQTDRHFRLTVEDRGSGVAPEFVPDLFERFSRSEVGRAAGIGTGLGLAIARSYARAHGGDLLYEDAEPHGARFQLVLPRRPAQGDVVASRWRRSY
jgi:signal transduction histidine kinase